MSKIKTILVHLADDDHHEVRLKVAIDLAKKFDAHLTALFITFPVGMPPAVAGRGASTVFIDSARQAARKKAQALEKEFASTCEKANIPYNWLVDEGEHLEALTYHAHAADLVIVSQSAPGKHLEDRFRMRVAEELTMVSGSPILLLPRSLKEPNFGKNILVAWRASKESVRAVRDSLHFLDQAETVNVLSVGPRSETKLSETELVEYLARHNIKANPKYEEKEGRTVAESLMESADEYGSDLIVMGAYGHSWIRELILGGVTREMFMNCKVPLLLSH